MDSDDEHPRRGRGHVRRQATQEVVSAAYYGSVEALGAALRQGGDIEEVDVKENWRPLHAAVFTESTDAVLYLLRMRAEVNAPGPKGQSALHMAARDNSDELVRLLVKFGADCDIIDEDGQTAEAIATSRGSLRVLSALAELLGRPVDERSPAAVPASDPVAVQPQPPVLIASAPLLRSHAMARAAEPAVPSGPVEQAAIQPKEDPDNPCRVGGRSLWFGSAVDPDDDRNLDAGREAIHEGWEAD
mmetsp:Transcript_63300/g.137718  ORF Transcript_63300/g.137718 Transcript_63300/m.137718 type:complete len:245 (+) Transcript_63300:25-759(+)